MRSCNEDVLFSHFQWVIIHCTVYIYQYKKLQVPQPQSQKCELLERTVRRLNRTMQNPVRSKTKETAHAPQNLYEHRSTGKKVIPAMSWSLSWARSKDKSLLMRRIRKLWAILLNSPLGYMGKPTQNQPSTPKVEQTVFLTNYRKIESLSLNNPRTIASQLSSGRSLPNSLLILTKVSPQITPWTVNIIAYQSLCCTALIKPINSFSRRKLERMMFAHTLRFTNAPNHVPHSESPFTYNPPPPPIIYAINNTTATLCL